MRFYTFVARCLSITSDHKGSRSVFAAAVRVAYILDDAGVGLCPRTEKVPPGLALKSGISWHPPARRTYYTSSWEWRIGLVSSSSSSSTSLFYRLIPATPAKTSTTSMRITNGVAFQTVLYERRSGRHRPIEPNSCTTYKFDVLQPARKI